MKRLELVSGKKRQWLPGLVIGVALGVAVGFAMDVDPVRCEFDDDYFCSRGEAVAAMGGTSAAMGAGIGALVRRTCGCRSRSTLSRHRRRASPSRAPGSASCPAVWLSACPFGF